MKYIKKPLKTLWSAYPKTILTTAFSLFYSGMALMFGVMVPQNTGAHFTIIAWGIWFAGGMYPNWMCERHHTHEWYRKLIDAEFEKAAAVIEATKIVEEGEEWKK